MRAAGGAKQRPSRAGARNGPASRRRQGSPPVKGTPPRACAGLEAPQTSRTSQSAREDRKKPVRGSESKAGTSREGPEPRQGSPRAKHLLRAPVQAWRPRTAPERPNPPGGPQKACTRLWEQSRDSPGGTGEPPAGDGPPVKRTSPRPCAGPAAPDRPGNVPIHPEGGKKPLRGSGSETGASPQGETPARPGASRPRPEHRPASRAGPGRARREQSHGQPGAMNPGSQDGNRGRDRRLPRPGPGAVRKERRRRAAPAGRPSGR